MEYPLEQLSQNVFIATISGQQTVQGVSFFDGDCTVSIKEIDHITFSFNDINLWEFSKEVIDFLDLTDYLPIEDPNHHVLKNVPIGQPITIEILTDHHLTNIKVYYQNEEFQNKPILLGEEFFFDIYKNRRNEMRVSLGKWPHRWIKSGLKFNYVKTKRYDKLIPISKYQTVDLGEIEDNRYRINFEECLDGEIEYLLVKVTCSQCQTDCACNRKVKSVMMALNGHDRFDHSGFDMNKLLPKLFQFECPLDNNTYYYPFLDRDPYCYPNSGLLASRIDHVSFTVTMDNFLPGDRLSIILKKRAYLGFNDEIKYLFSQKQTEYSLQTDSKQIGFNRHNSNSLIELVANEVYFIDNTFVFPKTESHNVLEIDSHMARIDKNGRYYQSFCRYSSLVRDLIIKVNLPKTHGFRFPIKEYYWKIFEEIQIVLGDSYVLLNLVGKYLSDRSNYILEDNEIWLILPIRQLIEGIPLFTLVNQIYDVRIFAKLKPVSELLPFKPRIGQLNNPTPLPIEIWDHIMSMVDDETWLNMVKSCNLFYCLPFNSELEKRLPKVEETYQMTVLGTYVCLDMKQRRELQNFNKPKLRNRNIMNYHYCHQSDNPYKVIVYTTNLKEMRSPPYPFKKNDELEIKKIRFMSDTLCGKIDFMSWHETVDNFPLLMLKMVVTLERPIQKGEEFWLFAEIENVHGVLYQTPCVEEMILSSKE